MGIKVVWKEGCEFSVVTEKGFEVAVDSENVKAPCPTELLLSALGSCSATDVVMGLKEQGVKIERFQNEVTYTLTSPADEDAPRLYETANLHFVVEADSVTPAQIEQAAENALNKYCHVCLMLQPKIKVSYTYDIAKKE